MPIDDRKNRLIPFSAALEEETLSAIDEMARQSRISRNMTIRLALRDYCARAGFLKKAEFGVRLAGNPENGPK